MRAIPFRLLALSLLWLAAACAPQASSPAGPSNANKEERTHPIPRNRVEAVRTAVNLGRELYRKDKLAAAATDELIKATAGQPDSRVRGWIVSDGSEPKVVFIGQGESGFVPVYEVSFSASAPDFEVVPDGTPLEQDLELQFRAREFVHETPLMKCSDRYNTVVLPASIAGERGWFVYALAATTIPDLFVIGGHHRIHVAENAESALSVTPFSKACLNLPSNSAPAGGESVAVLVTHIVSDVPAETHVFLSLLHGKPIYVGTALGTWKVSGGDIRYLGPHPED